MSGRTDTELEKDDDEAVLSVLPATKEQIAIQVFILKGARCRPDLWAKSAVERLKKAQKIKYVRPLWVAMDAEERG